MGRKKKSEKLGHPVPTTSGKELPSSYPELLEEVKRRISQSQTRAAVSVNRELIQLYWEIGHMIVERQEREGWGTSVINRLADDIQTVFPGILGFSRTNVSRMRKFHLPYTKEVMNSQQAVPNFPSQDSARSVPNPKRAIAPADFVAARPGDGECPPPPALIIPWGHNVVLLFKTKARERGIREKTFSKMMFDGQDLSNPPGRVNTFGVTGN